MLYIKKLIESVKLEVELPLRVECVNKSTVELVNGWSVSGNSKHINIRINFLRKLKENGLLCVEWVLSNNMVGDLYTKNLDCKDV